ncbi:MAG: hypothetical protein ABSB40_05350 [Nitrososphaeria archaeon]|jgi:hypothetical protein
MTEQPKPDTSKVEKVEVDKWNEETKKGLRNLQVAIENLADSKHEKLEANAARTFKELRWMIWITFAFGLGLVLTSVVFFVAGKGTLSVLGLGSLGVADWLALFFYKPMDRLQEADKDYLQQMIVVKGWALSISLEMLAMKVDNYQSMIAASKNIRSATYFAVCSLNEFVLPTQPPQEGESSTQPTQTTPPSKKL